MMGELLRQLKECDADEDIRAIIVTGSREYFSVGFDIHELARVKTYGEARCQTVVAAVHCARPDCWRLLPLCRGAAR
jgi:enoyl-CoA hydratase/carnithine racemase